MKVFVIAALVLAVVQAKSFNLVGNPPNDMPVLTIKQNSDSSYQVTALYYPSEASPIMVFWDTSGKGAMTVFNPTSVEHKY